MTRLPKFTGRSRGPLRDDEDVACRQLLGSTLQDMQRLFEPLGHHLAGRVQRYRGADCPCIYVFYDRATFENGQRGLMYFAQNLEDIGYEIVFRQWKSHPPIGEPTWRELASPEHDDRYKVCSASHWKWRALQVRSRNDFERAQQIVQSAKSRYKDIFSIFLSESQ